MEINITNKTKSRISLTECKKKVLFFTKVKKIEIDSLSVSFINDEEMTEINNKFLSHEGSTDIITFDYSEKEAENDKLKFDGEILICTDEAKRQARRYKVKLQNELTRLIFHGLLHLYGLNDETNEEKIEMKKNEDLLLDKYFE